MKTLAFITLAALASACAFEPATSDDVASVALAITNEGRQQAQQTAFLAYQLAYGEPSTTCRNVVASLDIDYLPQTRLQAACGASVPVGGCSYYSNRQVFIEDVLHLNVRTHAHEFLHMLLQCQTGSPDHDHTRPAWVWLNWLAP